MKKLSFIYVFIVAALIFSLVGGAFTSPPCPGARRGPCGSSINRGPQTE
ncbi:hypothetical protein QTG56_21860 [Rossellomorea sp. AcN35-11]|nr:hypothetical protein QTG56_21860 [Rossellomorea sp. AcN35-11]